MKNMAAFFLVLVMTTFCFSACAVSKTADSDIPEIVTIIGNQTEPVLLETDDKIDVTEADIVEATESDVIKEGYMTNLDICTQDEYEETLFGQIISVERNGEMRLGIKCTHDSYAELTIYEAQDGKYVELFSCPAVIGKNGPAKHAEGDTKTPLGTWTIGEAYGIKEDPGSILPYTQVTDDMYWCATGSNGKKYNQLIYRSDDPDANYDEDEHLIEYEVPYAYFIDLGYNSACVPYAGNAIFLHCWRAPDYPTGGCVAVAEEDMVNILHILKPGTVVTIY